LKRLACTYWVSLQPRSGSASRAVRVKWARSGEERFRVSGGNILTEMRIRFSGNPSTTPDADPLLGCFRVWDLTYILKKTPKNGVFWINLTILTLKIKIWILGFCCGHANFWTTLMNSLKIWRVFRLINFNTTLYWFNECNTDDGNLRAMYCVLYTMWVSKWNAMHSTYRFLLF